MDNVSLLTECLLPYVEDPSGPAQFKKDFDAAMADIEKIARDQLECCRVIRNSIGIYPTQP